MLSASHAAELGYGANGAKIALSVPSLANSLHAIARTSFAAEFSDLLGSSISISG
jgi:hypothetical protein